MLPQQYLRPCRRRNSLHRLQQQSRMVTEREMAKARLRARAKERKKIRKRPGRRPKFPQAKQVMRARQRLKLLSLASSIQKESAIVAPLVLSATRPPEQMQPKRIQVQPQRSLQRRQQQSHLSCLALHQPRCATPVALVFQRISLGLD